MALGSFGIKEVADVRFYEVGDVTFNPTTGKIEVLKKGGEGADKDTLREPALEFTTLKVSNLEFTAEQSEARGGKGNAPLIIWDYGREVNITLEDALLSTECLRKMFGDKSASGPITIGANEFPGNYAVVGVTFARDQITGKDHLFTFYVPNAKVGSEITLTMEAEGDPTVFSMALRALRASKTDDTMVALIPYEDIYTAQSNVSLIDAGMAGAPTSTDN